MARDEQQKESVFGSTTGDDNRQAGRQAGSQDE